MIIEDKFINIFFLETSISTRRLVMGRRASKLIKGRKPSR